MIIMELERSRERMSLRVLESVNVLCNLMLNVCLGLLVFSWRLF